MMSNEALRTRVSNLVVQKSSLEHTETHGLRNERVYPVLTLPPEITAEIFVHCLPAFSEDTNVLLTSNAPLLLTHVCRAWREICHATPALWHIFATSFLEFSKFPIEIVKVWFERSGQHPLSVWLSECSFLKKKDFLLLMETFQRHSNRIIALGLELGVLQLEQLDALAVDFSALQELNLALDIESDLGKIGVFRNAPLLRKVVLNANIPHSSIDLPWKQLTQFEGKEYIGEECVDALALMPDLTHVEFQIDWIRDSDRTALRGFAHPKILFFRITEPQSYLAKEPHLLKWLTLPTLQTLELVNVTSLSPQLFHSFLQRSSPPLRRVLLGAGDYFDNFCFPLLEPIQKLALTELEILNPTSTFLDDFFEELSSSASFFPYLHNISFRSDDLPDLVRLTGSAVTESRLAERLAQYRWKSLRLLRVLSTAPHPVMLDKLKFSGKDLEPFWPLTTNECASISVYIGTETNEIQR